MSTTKLCEEAIDAGWRIAPLAPPPIECDCAEDPILGPDDPHWGGCETGYNQDRHTRIVQELFLRTLEIVAAPMVCNEGWCGDVDEGIEGILHLVDIYRTPEPSCVVHSAGHVEGFAVPDVVARVNSGVRTDIANERFRLREARKLIAKHDEADEGETS